MDFVPSRIEPSSHPSEPCSRCRVWDHLKEISIPLFYFFVFLLVISSPFPSYCLSLSLAYLTVLQSASVDVLSEGKGRGVVRCLKVTEGGLAQVVGACRLLF